MFTFSRCLSLQSRSATRFATSLRVNKRSRPWFFADFFRPGVNLTHIPPNPHTVAHPPISPGETWGDIPEAQLPEPWSCDWRRWGLTTAAHFHINSTSRPWFDTEPALLKPLLYRRTQSDDTSFAFLGTEQHLQSPRFYFYDALGKGIFRFDQVLADTAAIGVADFIETANWNQMTLTHVPDHASRKTTMLRNRKTSGPPLLLRDMHEGPWGTEPRGIKPGAAYTEVTPMATVRDWCWIPESDLPESWSCVWIRCFWYWISAQNEFYRTYTFPNPHPIMFHSGEGETVLLESAGRFYLYGLPEYAELYQFYSDTLCPSLLFPQVPAWSPYVHDTNRCLLYQFDGVYSSVADFLEHADWTRMSLVAPKPLESPPTAGSSHLESIKAPMLPMTDYGGPLRIAANTHVRKRTLWDTYRPPGTWGFAPRYTHNSDVKKVWDRSQHSVLPAPWAWFNPQNTPSQRNVSELQRFWFTPALTPVMFRCPELPGASNQMTVYSSHGKYYLEDEDLGSRLWEFQGTYASVDDFIDNADWNKLDPMENEEDKEYYEYWPEERKRDVGR